MRVTTTSTLKLPVGTELTLDARQAADRGKTVEPVKGKAGRYVALQILQFKAGESITLHGDVPKALADQLEPLAPAKAAKAQAPAFVADTGTGTGTGTGLPLNV